MHFLGAKGRALVIAGALMAGVASAQDATLTPTQMAQLGNQLLQDGRPAEALSISSALLQRDPNDVSALILQSRIAAQGGDYAAARTLAARAYAATDNSDARFIAARLAARGHAEDGQDTRAQIWLRRARQYAPNADASQAVADDYRLLRRRNPLAFDLRFGISPSNNVNNGSANSETNLFGLRDRENNEVIFDLSGAARALSGLEISAGASATYRLSVAENYATYFDADVNLRTYRLSNEAQEQAPDAKGSDFADANVAFGLRGRFIFAEGMQPTTLSAKIGKTWYGGDPYTEFLELRGAQSWRITPADTVSASLSFRQTDYLTDDAGTTADDTVALSLGWTQRLGSGDRVRLSATYRDNASDVANRTYQSGYISGGYEFAQPIAGVRIGVNLGVEERYYPFSSLAGGASRTDQILSGAVTARFTQVEYFGFQPVVKLQGSAAESTLDLYDRDNLSLGFDLESAF